MSAFMHAWNLLKAIPGQQGYMGTLPPAVLQMLARRRAEAGEEGLGDVMDMRRTIPAQFEGQGDNRRMVSPMRQVDMPSEAGDMRPGETFMPDPLPATDRRVQRDLTPLREMQQTMISQRDAEEMAGDTQSMGVTSAPSMANVRGFDTMPEESFFSPREQRLAREGMEQSAGRQLTGGQRGGRTDIRGGSGAGMNLPLRGVDDEGKRMRPGSRRRRATTLQNVEGVGTGARLGGASREFVDQPEETRKPTQQETIANILSGMATAAGGTFEDKTPPREAKPTKERPLRQMSNRYRENLERVRQGEKPDLNVPMDEDTMSMFQDPASAESQAIRERLMQFAGQRGRTDGSPEQSQIDRAA
tara:strand:- start:815 stop:1891 length:1077 start_codon:yes stop_codon:yes gene_type:complete